MRVLALYNLFVSFAENFDYCEIIGGNIQSDLTVVYDNRLIALAVDRFKRESIFRQRDLCFGIAELHITYQ